MKAIRNGVAVVMIDAAEGLLREKAFSEGALVIDGLDFYSGYHGTFFPGDFPKADNPSGALHRRAENIRWAFVNS